MLQRLKCVQWPKFCHSNSSNFAKVSRCCTSAGNCASDRRRRSLVYHAVAVSATGALERSAKFFEPIAVLRMPRLPCTKIRKFECLRARSPFRLAPSVAALTGAAHLRKIRVAELTAEQHHEIAKSAELTSEQHILILRGVVYIYTPLEIRMCCSAVKTALFAAS